MESWPLLQAHAQLVVVTYVYMTAGKTCTLYICTSQRLLFLSVQLYWCAFLVHVLASLPCMYMCIYTYTYNVCTYMYMYVHCTGMCPHMCMYNMCVYIMYTFVHLYTMYTVQLHVYSHTCTCTCTCVHVYIHVQPPICKNCTQPLYMLYTWYVGMHVLKCILLSMHVGTMYLHCTCVLVCQYTFVCTCTFVNMCFIGLPSM